MNWLDIAFVIVAVIVVAAGAKLGSIWTSACIVGGFVGMALVDLYGLALTERFPTVWGASYFAQILLFIIGVLVAVIPGWVLSRVSSVLFLGIIDGLFGLLTGVLAILMLLVLGSLLVIPSFPSIEKKPLWKKSVVVRPLQNFFETHIERH